MLLFTNCFTGLRGAAVRCPSLYFEYSMGKRKSCTLTKTCAIINTENSRGAAKKWGQRGENRSIDEDFVFVCMKRN